MNSLPTTIEARKAFLETCLAKGKVISATWTKKNGEARTAALKSFSEKALSSGDKNIVQESSTAHIDKYFTCYMMEGEKSKYCKLDLTTLSMVKSSGIVYS